MNMLKEHRRNPTRRRAAPKRFEDEKFVSGAIDRYQHCYDANKEGKYDRINGDENYYTSSRGHKFTTLEWNDVYEFCTFPCHSIQVAADINSQHLNGMTGESTEFINVISLKVYWNSLVFGVIWDGYYPVLLSHILADFLEYLR